MDRFAYLKRLVETNSALIHHLEDHILGMLGTEKETVIHEVHEDMVRKYLAAMKEVHSGLECFLIFNKSQELQNVIHGLNLQFPRMGSPTQYTTMSKYPNVIPQHEIQEAMIANLPQVKEEPVILSQSAPPTVQAVLPAPPPPPPMEKKKKRKSKRDLLPPPLDMKKIKEEEEKMRTGHGQPAPQVPPTPCNDTLDLEQFFQFLPNTQ